MNEIEEKAKATFEQAAERKITFNAPLWVVIGLLMMTAGVMYFVL